jgi:hypothetical protein
MRSNNVERCIGSGYVLEDIAVLVAKDHQTLPKGLVLLTAHASELGIVDGTYLV